MTINILTREDEIRRENLNPDFKELGWLVKIRNRHGMEALFTPYGLRLVRLLVPNACGELTSVVLGYNSLAEYRADQTYQGAVVGPNANRIAGAKYTDPDTGRLVHLVDNDNGNNLHGGGEWSSATWCLDTILQPNKGSSATFHLESRALDRTRPKKFPGNVRTEVIVALTDDNSLRYDIISTTDATTVWNPTTHPYFNLNGAGVRDVRNHVMATNADRRIEVDPVKLVPVSGEELIWAIGRYDFSHETPLRKKFGKKGFDDCFVFPDEESGSMIIYSPSTGIGMSAYQDRSVRSAQFYTGYFLDGIPAPQFGGFCWEPANLIDAPNQPELCEAVGVNPFLRRAEEIRRTIEYHFFVKEQ